MMFAAWDVEPEASADEKDSVLFPKGRLLMKGEISTAEMFLPSSARIFTAVSTEHTNSRPSPNKAHTKS